MLCVMVLGFLISFAVVVKAVVKKQIKKQKDYKNRNIANPRERNIGLEFIDDTELTHNILVCIVDNKSYLIKDPEIIKIIFALVKAKIKNESLSINAKYDVFFSFEINKQ